MTDFNKASDMSIGTFAICYDAHLPFNTVFYTSKHDRISGGVIPWKLIHELMMLFEQLSSTC